MSTKANNNIKTKKDRNRSPSYPAIDLELATILAKVLYDEIGQSSSNVEVVLGIWGHKPQSGSGLVKLAALKKFGLIEDEGSKDQRRAKLTQLALTIVLDEEKKSVDYYKALEEAAMNPVIHQELWNRYSGSIPSDNTLRLMLAKEYQFSERGVKEFIEQFRRTIEFAMMNKSGNIISEEKKSGADKRRQSTEWADNAFDSFRSFLQGSQMNMDTQKKPDETQKDQEITNFSIPLTNDMGFIIRHRFPMSTEEWEYMMSLLELYKKRLVQTQKDKKN